MKWITTTLPPPRIDDPHSETASSPASQWEQIGLRALSDGKTAEALEAASRLRSWPRLSDLGQYLEILFSGLRLEALATLALGDAKKSEEALRRWLEFSLSNFGLDSDKAAAAQVELGRFLINQKRSEEALPILQRAAATRFQLSTGASVETGDAYFYFALALDKSGRDTQAMTTYRTAYNFYSKALGPADPRSLLAALNLAEAGRVAHDYESAEFWFRYTLRMSGEPDGNRSSDIALALNNLAETLLAVGRPDEAAPLAEQSLAMRLDLFGSASSEYERSLGVVALIALKRGNRPRLDAALDDFKSRSPGGSLSLPSDLAIGYLELLGRPQQAIKACENALVALESSGRTNDSLMPGQQIGLRLQLGRLYSSVQNWPEARRHLFEAFRLETVFLSDEAADRSHRQMQQLLAESRSRIAALLDANLLVESETQAADVKAAYEILQQRRAMETRLLVLQKLSFVGDRALTSVSQEHLDEIRLQVASLVTRLSAAREGWLASLLQQQRDPASDPDGLDVRSHQEYVEHLEKSLAAYVGEGSRDFALMGLTSSTPPMEPGEAIIEYFLAEATGCYYAFVVTGEAVHLAALGDAASIHLALAQMRDQVISAASEDDADPVWRRRGRFLFNRLLKPLLPWLAGVADVDESAAHVDEGAAHVDESAAHVDEGAAHVDESAAHVDEAVARVYIVPDAELYTLPFDLLPVDESQLAIDRWTITHLWNGGERAGFNLTFGSPADPSSPVVVASPLLSGVTGGADSRAIRFADLPSAAKEAEIIAGKIGATYLQGALATKAAVVALERPEILHFATHSFYIPRLAAGDAPTADLHDTTLYRTRAPLLDPLYRCGVALTGADLELSEPTAASPGILFASDVVDLDLRDTDLVVLSSCQSGLGDSRPGDGIQGLRRAFRVAGVKTVISSLWKVPDEATLEFMVALYDRLLAQMPRAQALREAKLELRQRYGNRPLFWAGFVLDGLDQALFRFHPLRGFKIANMSGTPLTYNEGMEAMEKGQWKKAIELFEAVLYSRTAEHDVRSKAAFQRATIFRRTGRLPQALEAYDALINDLHTPAECRKWAIPDRGLARMMSGDFHGALLDYDAALAEADLAPDYRAQLLVNRGVILGNLDDDHGALADWTEVVELPGAPPDQVMMALQNRADLKRRNKDCGGAMADVHSILDMPAAEGTRHRDNALLILALCYAESGNLAKAKSTVRRHLQERTSPGPRDGLKRLAKCNSAKTLTGFIGTLIQGPQ